MHRSFSCQEVIEKVGANKANIAKCSEYDVANEDEEVAEEHISIIVLWPNGRSRDWQWAGVNEVAKSQDSCKRWKVWTHQSQNAQIVFPIDVLYGISWSKHELSVCEGDYARVNDEEDEHQNKQDANATNFHEDGQVLFAADHGKCHEE